MPVLISESWFLNEIWTIELSSALVGMLMSSSKLFLFFERSSFKLKCETFYQTCCLLDYLCEINTGIHTYTSVTGCGVASDFSKNFGGMTSLADLHTPIHPPPIVPMTHWNCLISYREGLGTSL